MRREENKFCLVLAVEIEKGPETTGKAGQDMAKFKKFINQFARLK